MWDDKVAQEIRDICNKPLKVQCCVCHSLKSTDGTWIPYPERINEASHTFCPPHHAEERNKLAVYKAQKMAASVA